MSIIRTKKTDRYFVASNAPFHDERLSWEARGLMGYLLSKPDGWEVRVGDLLAAGNAGRDKMRRMLKEMQSAGYLVRKKVRCPTGKFTWVSEVYERSTIDGFSGHGKPPDVGVGEGEDPQPSMTVLSTDGSPTDGKPVDIVNTESLSTEEEKRPENGRDAPDEIPKKRHEKDLFPMAQTLASVCRINLKANRGWLFKEAKTLDGIGATAEDVKKYYGPGSWWYKKDWRGQKGEPPKPALIRRTWDQWRTVDDKKVGDTAEDRRERAIRQTNEWKKEKGMSR